MTAATITPHRYARYRVCAELGGGEFEALSEDENYVTLFIREGMGIRFSRRDVEEVRPPSIDDPVSLPLTIKPVGKIAESDEHMRIEVREDGSPAGTAAYLGTTAEALWLTPEQCRDAARALWRLGNPPPQSGPIGIRAHRPQADEAP